MLIDAHQCCLPPRLQWPRVQVHAIDVSAKRAKNCARELRTVATHPTQKVSRSPPLFALGKSLTLLPGHSSTVNEVYPTPRT